MRWAGETEEQWRDRVERGVQCFAWLPTQMADGEWVWWEHYWSVGQPHFRGGFIWRNGLTLEDARPPIPTRPTPPKPMR